MAASTEPTTAIPPDDGTDDDVICIRGARTHNLKNIDVDIPRDRLVVMTGPSGSGKSSLAFDTLFAEGQRQYIESLSVYARQFVMQLERPDVDLIEGLQPTICIDQRPGSPNPRSTVATATEIYDYLRLLFARVGEMSCFGCGEPIHQQSPDEIQEALEELPEGAKAMLLAPLVRGRKGAHKDVLAAVRKDFVRARIDGRIYDVEQLPELAPRKDHTIEAVVDRIVIRPGMDERLADAIDNALRHSEGLLIVSILDSNANDKNDPAAWQDRLFSTQYACPNCQVSFEEIEPRSFSFNSPYGACPGCDGLGTKEQFDPDLVIPDASLSPADGAIAAWEGLPDAAVKDYRAKVAKFLEAQGTSWQTPLGELPSRVFETLVHGSGKQFEGLLIMLEKQYATATRKAQRQKLEPFRGLVTCGACHGARLRPESRSVRVGGLAIHEVTALSVDDAERFFHKLKFPRPEAPIGRPIVAEINSRLSFLQQVGLGYLTLDRRGDSLSGGESQRVRLASGIGSGLVGVCYILDEPSIGLHARDNQRLIDALRKLEQQGNTVIVVEHDESMMRQADLLIDMGPGAGEGGGRVVAAGRPDDVCRDDKSITGKYLSGELEIPPPAKRRRAAKTRSIEIEGVTTNNLKNVSVRVPLGVFVCVTGVSGSGKSSLINETLAPALLRRLKQRSVKPGPHTALRGAAQVSRLLQIDQSPIGRTPRSNAATYTGAFDEIRKLFAGTKDAKQHGFKAGRFSFNAKGGRCDACEGQGLKKIEMQFLPNLYVRCPECQGARFNRQTLGVTYKGCSIADVLDMRVEASLDFFENVPKIHRMLASLHEVGLGYLTLGQPSTTLSGGEAQRVKLAAELGRVETGGTMYIFDEPTTGLHFDDIRRLLAVLQRLVDQGNTVLVIEHNLDVIKSADWIIDLGPEGGAAGGKIVAEGPPEKIAALDGHTGRYLGKHLSRKS